MNYYWIGKTIYKKIPTKKSKKKEKDQSEIAACEQNTTSEEANFGSNRFLTLISLSLLQFDFKIMKMYEQILKKDSAPIQFKFFELFKNWERYNSRLRS